MLIQRNTLEVDMECILHPCVDKGAELISVGSKGIENLVRCSQIREDGLTAIFKHSTSVQVHRNCRVLYIKRPTPPQKKEEVPTKTRRSSFDFKSLCFLCSKKCKDISKYTKGNVQQQRWSLAAKDDLIDAVRSAAKNRHDSWGEEVLLRLANVNDLTASDGRYHWYCYSRFCVSKTGASRPGTAATHGGSTSDADREAGFEKLCTYIEENDEEFSLEELKQVYIQLSPGLEPYTNVHLKRKLSQRYNKRITFTDIPGKKTVICLTETASNILSDYWHQNRDKLNQKEEELRLITAAAAIIRRDIKSRNYECSQYPTVNEIAEPNPKLVPESLEVLVSEIIQPTKKTKQNSASSRKSTTICHSIVSAVRTRSFVSPIQLGMAVALHRMFGSRLLIDMLSNMGVSTRYQEVLNYERSITSQECPNIQDGYVQFVFDNADYNVNTIDGHNTFHVMGGIACVTPKSALQVEKKLPRMNFTARAIENVGLFPVQTYAAPTKSGYSEIVALDLMSLQITPVSAENAKNLNFFWLSGNWLEGEGCKPGWSGCMELLYSTKLYQTSAVLTLPFINLAPSDPSTIYTALLEAAKRGAANGQKVTMVTFDQPLYAKAREMVASAPLDSPLKTLFIRLGGFHLLLSFLSAIGFIMSGSGLEELWSTVYAKNSVVHMMSGKAYSRAVRALYLVEEALITVFLKMHEASLNVDQDKLKDIYASFKNGNGQPEDIEESELLQNFVRRLHELLKNSTETGRTQKLWIQLIEMIEIVRMFIRAERSGDFNLHLHCVYRMLPIFHASGHLNYAKSAHVYLQDCLQLCSLLSESEYNKFITSGYFTIRRSDKFWSGIWSDMTIEQVLMRALKSNGGLSRGRGIKPSTIATWVSSMPLCSRVVGAMEEFAGVRNVSSEQHIELREANQKRNLKDLQTFISWIEARNPFSKSQELSSLSTGIVADKTVNCDSAFEIGRDLVKQMEGKKFSEIHLKRKLAVRSLATVTKGITIRQDTVCVNPNTLLHRMVCTVRTDEQLAKIFQYELCAYPPSLFDECGLMRKGSKSSMVKVLVPIANELPEIITGPGEISYVIDGGHLLHRVVWQCPASYNQICQQYTNYVHSHYGKCIVVFDGYGDEPTTKDEEHLRRSKTTTKIEVNVEDSVTVTVGQAEFLTNSKNKMQLISLLSTHLKHGGCHVIPAEGDADTTIVSAAINEAEKGKEAVVIGDDTDLLVLLVFHAPVDEQLKMVVPKRGNQAEKVHIIQEIQQALGPQMRQVILTVYAFTGCDTVSAIYKKGKISPFKKVAGSKLLQERLMKFNDPKASHEQIADAGNNFLLSIFSSKPSENLDSLRHRTYMQTVAKQQLHNNFHLNVLPPTSAAAEQHSYRAYFQVQNWLMLPSIGSNCSRLAPTNAEKLDPLQWGYKRIAGHLRPITTLQEAAPEDLLSLITCKCKEGCVKNCDCRRGGLRCTYMCKNCLGNACTNCDPISDADEELELSDIDE